MVTIFDFLEYKTPEGNVSYVKKSSVAAIYHDGRATRIWVGGDVRGDRSDCELIASEMPERLMAKLTAKKAGAPE